MTSNANSADVPAFIGFVDSTYHALRLINAARQGLIPRITRRLNDSERRTMIKSGAVFVFSVEESGIKRWTGTFTLAGAAAVLLLNLSFARRFAVVPIPYCRKFLGEPHQLYLTTERLSNDLGNLPGLQGDKRTEQQSRR